MIVIEQLPGKEQTNLSKQFMKGIGLEDFDMKVLDEDEFESKNIGSESSPSSRSLDSSSHGPHKYPLSAKDKRASSQRDLNLESKPSQLRIQTQQNSILTPHFGNLKQLEQLSDIKVSQSTGQVRKSGF